LADRVWDVSACGYISFLGENVTYELGDLLDEGDSFGRWLRHRESDVCSMVLSNTPASVACLMGAIVAGTTVVSIPLPPRGADFDLYRQFVENACRMAGSTDLLVDGRYLQLVPQLQGVEVSSYEQILAGGGRSAPSSTAKPSSPSAGASARDGEGFSLVQFTSGSTANPRGVIIDETAIAANVDAFHRVLQPDVGDNSLSWLPMSHDMGLIGMFFGSVLAGRGARNGTLYLMTPEHFLRRPQDWLAACAELDVTITAAPQFGLSLAVRRPPSSMLDLSRVRACIVGAEPIRAATLRSFEEHFVPMGFSLRSFCPAYGLAEATLAVTMTPVSARWSSIHFDPGAFEGGYSDGKNADSKNADRKNADSKNEGGKHSDRRDSDGRGWEIVSAGAPLPGYELSVDGDRLGRLRLRGPSMCRGYLGDTASPFDQEGWLETSDLGLVEGDNLYIVGRTDDVLVVAGRNIFAIDVEESLSTFEELRAGRVVAVCDRENRFVVAAELALASPGVLDLKRLERTMRGSIARRVGVAPERVVFVERGALPMTASGKIRRHAVTQAVSEDSLPTVAIAT
jgi:acyl-CoA synthetase (AMP-forming)/AMP-acid ligase II